MATATAPKTRTVQPPKVKDQPLFIGGKWLDSVSGKTFATVNPANSQTICQVAEGDKADVDLAVKAARKAFEDGPWPRTSAADRGTMWKWIEPPAPFAKRSQRAHGAGRTVAEEGKGVTEYANEAGVYKTIMTRHLLDLGSRDRYGNDGLGWIDQARDRTGRLFEHGGDFGHRQFLEVVERQRQSLDARERVFHHLADFGRFGRMKPVGALRIR